MNLLKVDALNNILEIKDDAKKLRNSIFFVFILNILNATLNILRLHKEEFNLLHGVWIILGTISILVLLLQRNNSVSKTINVAEIINYTHKENIWNGIEHIIIHLKNKKKRYIKIETKTQLEEVENILAALNIPKNVKIQKNNS